MSSDPNSPTPETSPVQPSPGEPPPVEAAAMAAYPRGDQRGAAIAAQAAVHPVIRNGASWFFWIAGLTMINSILTASGSEFGFATGLIVTAIVDQVAYQNKMAVVGVVFAAIASLVLVGLAVASGKGARWAFVLGIVGLVVDVLPALIAPGEMILSIGIHFWAIYCFFRGYSIAKHLQTA